MDIATGPSAASTAIGLVRELREIDRSVDEAAYKLKMAELSDALADAKISLADAKQMISRLETEVDELRNGEICPKCRDGRMVLVDTRPQSYGGLGSYGVQVWHYQCDMCAFENDRIHDPQGLTQKYISKR